jgi:hypothetical protein
LAIAHATGYGDRGGAMRAYLGPVLIAAIASLLDVATVGSAVGVAGCNSCKSVGGKCSTADTQSNCCDGLICEYDQDYGENDCFVAIGGDCTVHNNCAPGSTCLVGKCAANGSGSAMCVATGNGQGNCPSGALDCGGTDGCCDASKPFFCTGGSICYASAEEAYAACGTACELCGGGASAGGTCHIGTTLVQSASGSCSSGATCSQTDPAGINTNPFCAQQSLKCCCDGSGGTFRCWGCQVSETCGNGADSGKCCS